MTAGTLLGLGDMKACSYMLVPLFLAMTCPKIRTWWSGDKWVATRMLRRLGSRKSFEKFDDRERLRPRGHLKNKNFIRYLYMHVSLAKL